MPSLVRLVLVIGIAPSATSPISHGMSRAGVVALQSQEMLLVYRNQVPVILLSPRSRGDNVSPTHSRNVGGLIATSMVVDSMTRHGMGNACCRISWLRRKEGASPSAAVLTEHGVGEAAAKAEGVGALRAAVVVQVGAAVDANTGDVAGDIDTRNPGGATEDVDAVLSGTRRKRKSEGVHAHGRTRSQDPSHSRDQRQSRDQGRSLDPNHVQVLSQTDRRAPQLPSLLGKTLLCRVQRLLFEKRSRL